MPPASREEAGKATTQALYVCVHGRVDGRGEWFSLPVNDIDGEEEEELCLDRKMIFIQFKPKC